MTFLQKNEGKTGKQYNIFMDVSSIRALRNK